jgi:hypothetical protein
MHRGVALEKLRVSQKAFFWAAGSFICSAKALQWLRIFHPEFHQNVLVKIVRNQAADLGGAMVFALVAYAVFQRRWLAIAITLAALNLYELSQGLVRPVFWFDFGDSAAYLLGVVLFVWFKARVFPMCLIGRRILGP